MSEEEIEKEVQARVSFKMKEFLTGLENRIKTSKHLELQLIFDDNFKDGQKYQHYKEAFSQMKVMFQKELEMTTPINNMAETERREKRDKAINSIVNRLKLRGTRDGHEIERFLVQVIEKVQQ